MRHALPPADIIAITPLLRLLLMLMRVAALPLSLLPFRCCCCR